MPVTGHLRDFGVHDLFVLADMGRKTGVLRVRSRPPVVESTILFRAGGIAYAWISDRPSRVEELLFEAGRVSTLDLDHARRLATGGESAVDVLVRAGAVSRREVERLAREHIERAVCEILGWTEGTFSFEERALDTVPAPTAVVLRTEAVLMESARRSDEWSRISDRVADARAIPVLASAALHQRTPLDLAPPEWAVLAAIDGQSDVRAIAAGLTQPAVDVARAVARLAGLGLVEVRQS
jgi:hypothetical protein